MGFFRNLFEKAITARDLKVSLIRVDRDRKRKQLEVRKLSAKQGDLIDTVKKSRKEGNSLEVDYAWEELNGVKLDLSYLRRESRVLNLEGIALKRYIRGLERLEKADNRTGIKQLLDRNVLRPEPDDLRHHSDDTVLANRLNHVVNLRQ